MQTLSKSVLSSESSSTAVSVFNKTGLLDLLLQCLQRHPQNMELAISAVLDGILSSIHTTPEYTLLRTLAAGSLWNLKSGLSSAQQSQTLTALASTLSHSLSLDAGELIPELWHAESARLSKDSTSVNKPEHTEEPPASHEPEDMEEEMRNGGKPNGRKSKTQNKDFSDLLPRDRVELREARALLSAQQTSLEIIVNMCCSDDEVLKKAEFPSAAAIELCAKDSSWKCLLKKMERVQCRALTCLHNILSSMDPESLGGALGLQDVARHLSSLVFSSAGEIPCMTPQQLMSFCEAAASCELLSVRVNALAILGITGSSLAKEKNTAETLQLIGSALLNVATKEANLVVCGEALDALLDVFADGEEAETAAKNINLLSSLKALQPGFRAKLRKEGRGKYSPDQLFVLDNVRINLKRFIGYLENLPRN
ncbi:hypothetical protein DNTS_021954 [Danionella cerebrum]|uniref:SYO1-like TPR repeats domain-containing protein n=1 Tax=Danionella cerebrum TaxID=2873325 RepID=A0A553QMD5_9TELE|nr:hypothetical protein DNTS_021954 [Danionella translucida]